VTALALLIVEDEALLAMDIAMIAETAGHRVVGEAASLAEVAELPETPRPDAALVDVQLLHGSSGIDAACLIAQTWPGITILFVTANPTVVPAGLTGAVGSLPKPFSRPGMMAALGWLEAHHHDPATPLPPMLVPIASA